MRPPIPHALWQIDAATIDQHFLLEPGDACFYIWEYLRHAGFAAGPTNALIANLKKKPSRIQVHPSEAPHKQSAISYAGRAVRALIRHAWLDNGGTLVPMPCSKIAGHADFDDRLERVLALALHDRLASVKPLLEQSRDTGADHETSDRRRLGELQRIMRIDERCASGVPAQIIVFDDVLNSGKHFKVAQRILRARFPGVQISGLFLARCRPARGSCRAPDIERYSWSSAIPGSTGRAAK